jgi:carbonic anhydrase/acetyltransferase-like protein (isoleucine patch superfamily)
MRVRPFAGKRPRCGARVWVAADAVLVGDVVLGDDVSVWYGAVLRADINFIRIGARTNIQDGVVVHVDEPTVVGEEVTVGHGAVLHGCTIGDGALIGMGATVLNKAEVGERAVVAAGAVVPPGMRVPPRTVVAGVPAKVRHQVAEEELARIERGVRNYLELKGRYMASDDEVEAADPEEWEKLG